MRKRINDNKRERSKQQVIHMIEVEKHMAGWCKRYGNN